MPLNLALAGDIAEGSLEAFCEEIGHLHEAMTPTPVRIDLEALTNLSPAALSVLVSSLRSLRWRGICESLEVLAPKKAPCPIGSSDLQSLLSDRAGHGLHEGGAPPGSRPCEPFSTASGVTRAVSALQMRLAAETDWAPVEIASLGAMAADVAENVLQHSSSDGGGVAALRVLAGQDVVELAISDCGVGIRKSLVLNPRYEDIGDDLTALRTAVKPGATADPGGGGGYGLFLARLVLRDNGGSIRIRSGDADWGEGDDGPQRSGLARFCGSLIVVRARTDNPFNYDRIDEFLAQPGGVSDLG